MSQDTATLKHGEHTVEFPVATASEGNDGYQINQLLKTTGNVTLDPGFTNTASCRSAITFIDGDEGILRYRGYPIEQLAEKSTFTEVMYLVIYGELPTGEQLTAFEERLSGRNAMIDERMRDLFRCFPRRSHPMPVLSAGIMALSTFSTDVLSVSDDDQIEAATSRLLAQMPTLAAYAYKNSVGEPFLYP